MKRNLSAQAAAVDVASQFFRPGLPPKPPRESERALLETGLKAASRALWLLNACRDKLHPDLVAQLEAEI